MSKVKTQEELRKELSESLKESKRPIVKDRLKRNISENVDHNIKETLESTENIGVESAYKTSSTIINYGLDRRKEAKHKQTVLESYKATDLLKEELREDSSTQEYNHFKVKDQSSNKEIQKSKIQHESYHSKIPDSKIVSEDKAKLDNTNKFQQSKIRQNTSNNPNKIEGIEYVPNFSEDKVRKESTEKINTDSKVKDKEKYQTKRRSKKLDKIDSKLDKIDFKLEKVEAKTDKQSDKKEKARSSLKDRRVRFSGEVVGERTLATKVVTSPQKALNYSAGKLRTELEKEIHDSEMVGLELGQKGIASASKLKSASVSMLNKKVGFDRKAHNLAKSNKKENKLLRKEARKKTQQRKQITKKAKVQGKMYEGSVLDRVINFFKRDKKDTSEATKSFAPQLIIGIVLSVLLLITPVLVMIPMAGLGGIGSPTTEAFGFESAIDIPIDIEGYSYQAGNPYVPAGYRGQCTWFVWGRVHEVYDIRIPANLGDGGQWYNSVLNDSRFTVGDEPAIGSIAVFGGTQFGHVAFVENYNPDTKVVTFSEGNIGNPYRGTSGMVPYARTNYAELVREGNNWTLSNTRWDATLIGFIYIEPEKWE